MFASKATTQALRSGMRRSVLMTRAQPTRGMAGGKYLHVSEIHQRWGEAFGVVVWLWVFHRARHDLPVMYGFRHPWEHEGHGDHGHGDHHGGVEHHHGSPMEELEKFNAKAMVQGEVEDDEDDEDDEE